MEVVRKIYGQIKKVLYDYYLIEYEFFWVYESLFTHLKSGGQVLLLGLIK